jgi:hypothetical protein
MRGFNDYSTTNFGLVRVIVSSGARLLVTTILDLVDAGGSRAYRNWRTRGRSFVSDPVVVSGVLTHAVAGLRTRRSVAW